ncbi:MAG: glycosyltransferase family 4 protein [Burkholderiaceae bacterium]|nr:glycosyltransferase family 4 protein [Burkholderiaceae bacterium]
MKILLVHQNFPGQYKHLVTALAGAPGVQVVAMGDHQNVAMRPAPPGIERVTYSPTREPAPAVHPYLRHVEKAVLRGQATARKALELRRRGFVPDLICVHAAWGEALYLRDIFPRSPILAYFEFYYRARGADMGFDPEFPISLDDQLRIRTWNMTHQSSFFSVDWGVTPTAWQASAFPPEFRQRLSVIPEGIDTEALRPNPDARFNLPGGRSLGRDDEVVSFVSRGLEPYRGFHVFMRALPELLARRPAAQVVLVGGDAPSYGRAPSDAANWREKLLAEVGSGLDLDRVHFTGKIPYSSLLSLLQISRAHVYLTYPFVLSWSLLEAMSLGTPIAASSTAPVTEVIEQGSNGLLYDFFDRSAMLDSICRLLDDAQLRQALGSAARRSVIERYDLKSRCLPAQLALLQQVMQRRRPPPAAAA